MKSNREVAQLATDVLTMTLHGPLPMQTVAELAEGVIRLESENAALNEQIEAVREFAKNSIDGLTTAFSVGAARKPLMTVHQAYLDIFTKKASG